MKKFILILLIIVIPIIFIDNIQDYFYGLRVKNHLKELEKKVSEKDLIKFLRERFIDKRGLIISEIRNNKPSNYSLLESYGELMEYALQKKEQKLFDILLRNIKKYFLSQEGYLYWRINRKTLRPDNATALIDSLRILYNLVSAYENFRKEEYLKEAQKIADGILKYNTFREYFLDTYDGTSKKKIFKISLFYLDLEKIKKISLYLPEFKKYYSSAKNILEGYTKTHSPFFPKEYDYISKKYIFTENINILEQVLIALNMENKKNIDNFLNFNNMELYKNGKIYSYYHLKGEKIVNNEDPTIYSLISRLYMKMENKKKALETLKLIQRFENKKGIGDFENMNFYVFTQLETLLTLSMMEKRGYVNE